ncbi:MAG TPA: hypothetical protein VN228_04170, partial [Pyrinomonadaceae bacterium]|nr:hypothetical protein [Pyrinomonadaceae bacterium]
MRPSLLALSVIVVALSAAGAARASLPQAAAAKSRITTASGVRVRSEPRTAAAEVGRLPLGVVVRELERSAQKERVGEAE